MLKPLIFITTGDPCGIGPEVTVKALRSAQVQRTCLPVIIGEPDSLRAAGWSEKLSALIPVESLRAKPARIGPSAWGGEISFKALQLACKLAAQHRAAVVTAPISKQSWNLAGVP
ncbi:MAG: 4-hydroxythreonine-4-phosphate dehydrogenase PdxA, partial [Elusimicrobiaceae bacterium]|nr:4-hydroxythreonine-4-phosphate dehydrogenase PdxA [Elusimicrobiaceae bacterium]